MAKKSSSDLAGDIGALAETLQERAVEETRHYLGLHIEELFVTKGANADGDLDGAVRVMLDLPHLKKVAAHLAEYRDEDGQVVISDDFRMGILFAAKLMRDPEFDY